MSKSKPALFVKVLLVTILTFGPSLICADLARATSMTLDEVKSALTLAQQEVLDATADLESATELVTTSTLARDTAQTEYDEALATWEATKVTHPATTSTANRNVVLNGTFDDASNWSNIGMGSNDTILNSNIPRVYNGVLVGSYIYHFVYQAGTFPSPTRQVTFSYSMSNNNTNDGARPQADGYRVEFRTYNAAGQVLNYYNTRDRADSFPWTFFTATYNLNEDAVRWDVGFRMVDNGYWNGNFAGSIDNVSVVTQVQVVNPETYTYGEEETVAKDSAYQALQYAQASLSSAVVGKSAAELRLTTANAEVVRLTQLVADLTPRLNAPTNLVANIVGDNVELSWDAPESNSSGVEVERYAILWSTTNFLDNGWAWAHDQTSVSVPLSILESSGGLGNTFQFAIRADNDTLRVYSARSAYSSIVTIAPVVVPTPEPTPVEPTPTPSPTPEPTETPTPQPTEQPTPQPTEEPTPQPTPEPELEPTPEPTEEPTPEPTEEPTEEPTPETTPNPEEIVDLPEEITPEALMEINLDEIVATDLTPEQAESLIEAALETFETAEQGSPEYEQALDALFLAASQDDIVLDEELLAIPLLGDALGGAVELVNFIGNAGSDMSPQVRETSEEVVVAAVVATQVASVATMATGSAPTSGGAPAGGPSSGGGGAPVGSESKSKPKTRKQVKTKAKTKTTIKKPRIKLRRSIK